MQWLTDSDDQRPGERSLGLAAAIAIVLLGGCATQQAPNASSNAAEPRVVRMLVRPLAQPSGADDEREFTGGSIRGALDAAGKWRVRGEVSHPRLRCATYQLGVRFGIGDAACDAVEWRAAPAPLPSRRQCNDATLIHGGEGVLNLPPNQISALDCVRVTVQCTGACG